MGSFFRESIAQYFEEIKLQTFACFLYEFCNRKIGTFYRKHIRNWKFYHSLLKPLKTCIPIFNTFYCVKLKLYPSKWGRVEISWVVCISQKTGVENMFSINKMIEFRRVVSNFWLCMTWKVIVCSKEVTIIHRLPLYHYIYHNNLSTPLFIIAKPLRYN